LTAFKKNDQIDILTTGYGKYETGNLPHFKVREFGRNTLINHK